MSANQQTPGERPGAENRSELAGGTKPVTPQTSGLQDQRQYTCVVCHLAEVLGKEYRRGGWVMTEETAPSPRPPLLERISNTSRVGARGGSKESVRGPRAAVWPRTWPWASSLFFFCPHVGLQEADLPTSGNGLPGVVTERFRFDNCKLRLKRRACS